MGKEKPMTEYIKREDVITLAKQGKLVSNRSYESVCAYINSVPAADVVERKKGRWIQGKAEEGALHIPCVSFRFVYTELKCSNCGWSHSLLIPRKYCPNCGSYNGGDDNVDE